ncbi:MAG: hypothetical protein O7D28_02235, partial [Actinobacteria bacterium]|nr:hypothetical protein [Actinomycetota bacterium]
MSSTTEHDPDLVAPHPGGAYKIEGREFPWWLVGLLAIIAAMIAAILFSEEYQQAFKRIFPVPLKLVEGIAMTFYLTLGSFIVATFMGLFIGLARVSKKTVASN